MFSAINFYGPTGTFGHYICHLSTKNYAKLCDDKTVSTKATKAVLGHRSFQESVYIFFYIQGNALQKETFESIFHISQEDQEYQNELVDSNLGVI